MLFFGSSSHRSDWEVVKGCKKVETDDGVQKGELKEDKEQGCTPLIAACRGAMSKVTACACVR